MRISRLATLTGVPASTLRFYEGKGLLRPDRTASGHRIYGEDAVRRLAFVAQAKRVGLPLEEIAELLSVWDARCRSELDDDLRLHIASRMIETERRAADFAAFTTSLRGALDHLDRLPDR